MLKLSLLTTLVKKKVSARWETRFLTDGAKTTAPLRVSMTVFCNVTCDKTLATKKQQLWSGERKARLHLLTLKLGSQLSRCSLPFSWISEIFWILTSLFLAKKTDFSNMRRRFSARHCQTSYSLPNTQNSRNYSEQ